jgi:hypothetical protein
MACYGAAVADGTDMPSVYIENDGLRIRGANIDANKVHSDAPLYIQAHRVRMSAVSTELLL